MSEPISGQEPDFAAFVGIDWADREHAWTLQAAGGKERERGKFANTPEAVDDWAVQLLIRFEGKPVAVALEQSRGALTYALRKYGHLVLYPIHPSTSHTYRTAIFPSGSKDDPKDADISLDLLMLHRNRLRPLRPDTELTRQLQRFVEKRRQLVDDRTAQTNRITEELKLYFPQVLHWFDELHAPITAAFLQRWPTLQAAQKEEPESLRTFFHQHGSRSAERIAERLQQLQQAKALTSDADILEPGVRTVETLLRVVAALNQGIRDFEKAIAEAAMAHPDYAIFASFPAAGATMAPRLLAAFGSQRERYGTAREVQSFSGIAPVTQASGRQRWIHFRWACPKFLRQTFHEYAALSIQQCAWAKAFYQQQKDNGKKHHAAVRSLAFKWIRILFRCWQSRCNYDEDRYVRARTTRVLPVTRSSSTTPQPPVASCQCVCGKRQDSGLKKIGDVLKSLIAEA